MGVYDYLASQYGQQAAQQFSANTDSTMENVAESKSKFDQSSAGRAYNSGNSAPWLSDDEKSQVRAANDNYNAETAEADKGMAENAPESEDEKKQREKRERNRLLIQGIGGIIDGVSAAIIGGDPVEPDKQSSADETIKQINDAKAERLARAQRYYEYGKAKRKAFNDLLAAKSDIADRRNKRRLIESQIAENEANARRQQALADNPYYGGQKSGTKTGSKSGSKTEDPEKYPRIVSSTGKRHSFKSSVQHRNACEAAMSKVPTIEPYFKRDVRTGELKANGTPEQIVAQYAASADSEQNTDFWGIIESYATKSDNSRSNAIWLQNGNASTEGSNNSGGGITLRRK